MKFREQTAKKKSIRQIAGMFLAVTVLLAGSPYIAEAAEIVKDMDGTAYAQDAAGFVYQIPKGATTKKGCSIYMYTGEKSTVTFPAKCNSYVVTNIGTNLGQLILTNLQTVKIPSGYTTIETQAFQNQTDLYQIEIPASVKTIGIDAFAGCNKARLTIVTPYGSAAETYAKANEIHYSSQTSLQIQAGYSKLYVGESRSIVVLNASVAPVWKSSNSSVVSVDADGRLTAKKAGTVKITATIGKKTYTYPYTVIARSQKNVLDIIWNQYVTSGMSDYEKAVAAQQWMQQNVSPNGTSVLAQKALEQGKANYKGFCEAYQLIMKHYGISAKVVNGKKHMENSVVIAGKKYTASTLETSANADKTYTTTTIPGLAVNRVTMVLSKGRTGTFKVTGQSKGITWSSSNTKVAVVNASGKVTAKGTGTAKVTLKVNGKTFACTVCVNKGKDYYGHTQSLKIKVTVAEPKFDLKLQKLDGNYILIRVKNNTKATFDRLAVRYSLKNSSGSEVAAKDEIVYRVMSGKTAYESIYVSSAADVDISQSSVKITAFDRNPEQKYKVLGKDKLSVTVTDEQVSDSSISFKLKKVNKTSQYVYGEIYIISYDANGTIIDVSTSSLYLDKKETKTTSETVSKSPYSHPNFDHYEIVYGGYYTKK